MATTSDVERELLQNDSEQTVAEHSSQITTQINLLDSKLEQKFSGFKHCMEDKDAYHDSKIQKIKSEAKASSSFKFRGNCVQFKFNNDVLDGVSKSVKAITDGDNDGQCSASQPNG
jgi:hypothetical protein